MVSQKRFLRQLLLWRSEWIEQRVLERARESGFGEVTPSMNRMFVHMGGRPIGLSELARRLSISRQAVHQCANEAAELGLVEFCASESDGRVKLLRFTERGWNMSESAAQTLEALEEELASRIGRKDLEELKRILSKGWTGENGD
ncbi:MULTISPECIES: MarR family transcriptional regulator [Paraburkholderia]|uniref:MarR family winged helix-turn-helix transcriptional regulator n=1 Tax=Paraburkholderia TaxID=1822464 RepID=UPI002AB726CC|nr:MULTISPECIES: MarR family transcriptional regulator [Paraburkholderia]